MLILSRKVGERIQIGEHITVMVTYIGEGRCKIGIEAPPNVQILNSDTGWYHDAWNHWRSEVRQRVLDALADGRIQSLSDEMDEEEQTDDEVV